MAEYIPLRRRDPKSRDERLKRARKWLRATLSTRQGRLALIGLLVLALAAGSAGVAVAAWTRACAGGCPTVEQIEAFAAQQASEVYDAEGGLLGLFFFERRQLVSLQDLPAHVPQAFIAIEDRRYFEHEGVDIRRVIGSIRDNVLEGFGASGASTITMQLARNLFPEQLPMGEKSMRRKVAEAKLAIEMERRFSKERILELYLNHIYLGAGAYGVEAAARTYFGKPASELTPIEAATLAALPKAPSYYNPRRNPDAAERRRNLVLAAMAETRVLSQAEADELRRQPLTLAPPSGVLRAPYFVEQIRRDLEEQFGELLYTGGLKIYTTLNPTLQTEAEQALEEHLREIEGGRYGRFPHLSYERFVQQQAEDSAAIALTPYLQGVVAVLHPVTGAVLALVGGRDFGHSQFNRATQAMRQPGSAFKPFVYAAALEKGRSPLYRVSDGPLFIAQSDGSTWSPRNYSGDFGGSMSLREALRQSRNLATIRLGQQTGINAVRDVARRAGIDTRIPGYPSVYIGAADVHPLDLIAAYAAFSNGGMRVEPHFIRRIEDNRGELLWEPPAYPEPALDPAVAWMLTDMLREVVDRGTGWAARNPQVGNLPYSIPAAGKTGTTNDATDVWFVGYTPDLLAGVWLGLDRPQTIMRGATGGGLAVPVWARVVRKFYEDREPPPAWERPPSVAVRQISSWTGRAVTADCPYVANSYTDYFLASAAPAPGCDDPEPREWVDPTPHLPGRPVFPGQPRVPAPEEYIEPPSRRRPGDTQ
ncbi:MAG TPA: PBP1A family penicillin-binding protein [Longimicrobiaceae bacterium]|nr:PBP1A family penicillin-binding protein [Longimicrobiaceae bacterium]